MKTLVFCKEMHILKLEEDPKKYKVDLKNGYEIFKKLNMNKCSIPSNSPYITHGNLRKVSLVIKKIISLMVQQKNSIIIFIFLKNLMSVH